MDNQKDIVGQINIYRANGSGEGYVLNLGSNSNFKPIIKHVIEIQGNDSILFVKSLNNQDTVYNLVYHLNGEKIEKVEEVYFDGFYFLLQKSGVKYSKHIK